MSGVALMDYLVVEMIFELVIFDKVVPQQILRVVMMGTVMVVVEVWYKLGLALILLAIILDLKVLIDYPSDVLICRDNG